MAIMLKYQVGGCWSSVEADKLAGCLSYYADLKDAAKHALDVGTGVQPMECYVDLQTFGPEARFDYLDKPFKQLNKNWGDVKVMPVIRHPEVLRAIAEA